MAIPNGGPRRPGASPSFFLVGAANFRSDHIDLFDSVLVDLVPHAEPAARADLAERLSVLANAPRALVGLLAREDEIAIAGPLLRRSPVIEERALIEIARAQGQAHLLALSERSTLSSELTTSSCAVATAMWSGARPAIPGRCSRKPDIRR
jgi:uncharacterized protein (DUF2336 family)